MAKITLSFDNGPDPVVTPQVLDTLARNGISATFFVVGKNLESAEGQTLIARAHREGHRIGNHTYSHTLPLGKIVDGREAVAEIRKTRDLIGNLAGPHPVFRPFGEGGILDRRVLCPAAVTYLCDTGFSCITWTSVPRDWENPSGWVETALRQITEQDETLLVLHDIPTGAMDHLEDFIVRARAAGATFRQDFPNSCVLIRDGKPTPLLDTYVSLTPFAA